MGVFVTYAGAAVHHEVRKIHQVVPGSYASEALATNRACERTVPFRELNRAFKEEEMLEPTVIFSDSSSSSSVTSLMGTATRMKHFMRHVHLVTQYVLVGENIVRHIPGVETPADFLT